MQVASLVGLQLDEELASAVSVLTSALANIPAMAEATSR